MVFELKTPKFWYKRTIISYLLLPFSFVYMVVVYLRRLYYSVYPPKKIKTMIIVVGNIVVGGAGKTPLVIFLAKCLKEHGYNPGIISRGYLGKSRNYPLIVTPDSQAEESGDEAVLLARRTGCLVVVSPNRVEAVEKLLATTDCNVVISDDGLQHYQLMRTIEIAVIDAEFGFGNGFYLPAGPLRESVTRLQHIDFIIKNYNTDVDLSEDHDNEYSMIMNPVYFYNLKDPTIIKTIDEFKDRLVHAFAAIASPDKFFQTLIKLGVIVIKHPYPDHYFFKQTDFIFNSNDIVVLTEKDGVKCRELAHENFWCLKVDAKVSKNFISKILARVAVKSIR